MPHTPPPLPQPTCSAPVAHEAPRWILWKQTLASVIKLALRSRRHGPPLPHHLADHRPALLLGNGPSLAQALENDADALRQAHLYVTNHFAQSPHYAALQPGHYVLFDPTFFADFDHRDAHLAPHRPAVEATLARISQHTTWPLRLYVQNSVRHSPTLRRLLQERPNITAHYLNYVVAEGLPAFRHWAYRQHRGYPRSRNVMHIALYIALHAGHQNLYLLGVENDYFRRIGVDDTTNRLFYYATYFYTQAEAPTGQRFYPTNMGNIGDFFEVQYLTLRGYYPLATWAQSQGQHVVNATPGSMVDAFARLPWPTLAQYLRQL